MHNLRVAVLVPNTIVADGRVLKQADTIAAAGHAVRVCGVCDKHTPPAKQARSPGVELVWRDRNNMVVKAKRFGRRLGNWLSNFSVLILLSVFAALAPLQVMDVLGMSAGERRLEVIVLASFAVSGAYWLLSHRGRKILALLAALAILLPLAAWIVSHAARVLALDEPLAELLASTFTAATVFLGAFLFLHRVPSKAAQSAKAASWREALGSRLVTEALGVVSRYAWTRALADPAIEVQPDVVHVHDLLALPAAVTVKRKTGAKLVFDAHEIYEDQPQRSAAAQEQCRRVLKRYEREVDRFITINDSIAGFYRENYPRLPKAVIIKNATVPAAPFRYDGRMHEAANLPRDQKILLYQGGFATKRGLENLVRAASFLDSPWTLVMMGWGAFEQTLRAISETIGGEAPSRRPCPPVVFLPPAPHRDLVYWTAGATVGAIPYENIGLNHAFCTPNKLWEYPNAGVPIVASPLVEMSKVIDRYGIGWYLPIDLEPHVIANRVNSLSPDAILKASEACRDYIAADGWPIYAERLTDLYKGMGKASAPVSRTRESEKSGGSPALSDQYAA